MRDLPALPHTLPQACRWALVTWLAATCLLSTGCLRRRLTVRSNPPGAQVFVDDQEIGTTPCSAAFVYYGTRKVTVMKDGYKTETVFQKLNPPWYQIPPLDFVTENVVPREIRDERIIDIELSPEQIMPQQKLLDRAQSLRDGARSGVVTPLIGAVVESRPPGETGVPGQGLPGSQPLPYEPLPPPSGAAPFRP